MAVAVIGWNVSQLSVVLVENIYTSTFIWNIAIIFVSLASSLQFLIVYVNLSPEYKMPRRIMLLFFIMPLLNAVVALTPHLSHFMREVELAAAYPHFELYTVRGPWFWVHTVYSYFLAVATVFVLARGHMRKPRFYRLSSTFMAVGVIVTLLGNLITLAGIPPFGLDATALAAAVTLIFIYLALTTRNEQNLFSRYARSKVFGYMEDYVLVLGEKGHITDFNPSAGHWFTSQGIDLRVCTLDSVLAALVERDAQIVESPEIEESRDIYISDDGFPLVLNLRIHSMIDEKRNRHGSVAFFSDVTQNRALLKRLEQGVGVDSLTGLPNRIAFDGAKARYNAAEHLPLSVIMCDLNWLKETNDTLGHKYGDMMLQTAAQIMENARQKQHFVARIGGDEFVFLLSGADLDYANSLINQMKQAMESYEGLPFRLSLAMGAATKHDESECIDEVIALADGLMYKDKKLMKEKGM